MLYSVFIDFTRVLPVFYISCVYHKLLIISTSCLLPMTRITNHLHKNVLSVIMDIIEMDHFREPGLDEVQYFLESTGTHGSVVSETAAEMDCTSAKIQSRECVLVDLKDSFSSMN